MELKRENGKLKWELEGIREDRQSRDFAPLLHEDSTKQHVIMTSGKIRDIEDELKKMGFEEVRYPGNNHKVFRLNGHSITVPGYQHGEISPQMLGKLKSDIRKAVGDEYKII